LEEFSYRGDATVKRPAKIDPESMEKWVDFVYLRDNPKGPHKEHWRHAGGCGAWIVVERHTVTHEISSVRLAKGGKGRAR
jgi:sarcosine oxidase subunit delta